MGHSMTVIVVFIAFVLIGDAAAVSISYLCERISNSASLVVFFALFGLVFYLSWKLAVFVTERYLVRQD